MKSAIVIASVFGIVVAYASVTRLTSASSARAGPTAPGGATRLVSSVPQADSLDFVAWRITSPTRAAIRAELKSSVLSVRPYFDGVRLERMSGTGRVVCGNFTYPALTDDGAFRTWIYTIERPTVGACGGSGAETFSAVGVKGVADYRTQEVP